MEAARVDRVRRNDPVYLATQRRQAALAERERPGSYTLVRRDALLSAEPIMAGDNAIDSPTLTS